MHVLNISEAKAKLSSVIAKVEATGNPAVIGRNGKPSVKIIPYQPAKKKRRLGVFEKQIQFKPAWDEWPEDIAKILGM